MQEGRYHLLLVQATSGREADSVDARELLIGAVPHKILDRADRCGIGRAAQGFEQSIDILHARSVAHSPPCRTGPPAAYWLALLRPRAQEQDFNSLHAQREA